MNPERINRAMRLCHAELLKWDTFSASKAHDVIQTKMNVCLEAAQSLFSFMRILNYIEDCPQGGFHAARRASCS